MVFTTVELLPVASTGFRIIFTRPPSTAVFAHSTAGCVPAGEPTRVILIVVMLADVSTKVTATFTPRTSVTFRSYEVDLTSGSPLHPAINMTPHPIKSIVH